ncbi:unnamed protein product [Rodentolepis nana]|uniref:Uncharacterized protein n=1 Tax=Rodentolepis nana TaxID=102285 RepID=A0A0R3TQJ0_RODNA|nr:unnamed protein product [Rodentolepis nana]
MSFPMKLSSSKSGRLTHQEDVVSNASGHFHDSNSISPSNQDLLNPKHTLLVRAELPKPMSRLPEIRLEEDGGDGNGNKGLIAQMKPQKSCESYDSTASGMSWSSSQSAAAISGGGSGYGNSASVSGNLSYSSYEEDERPISRIPSNPGVIHRSQYSPRVDSSTQKGKYNFRTGYSFEEEHHECSTDGQEEQNLVNDQADVFFQTVFDDREKNLQADDQEIEVSVLERAKRKSFKRFWQRAYNAIKTDFVNKDSDSKFRSSKNKVEKDEPEEIDPVYQLLKSAATQRQKPMKSATSFDQADEPVRRPPRLSSSSRTSSLSQKERSQPP